jgi:EEF1A N-terminal glycine/lysine methyltransferase
MGLLRSSVLSSAPSDRPTSNATSLFPYHDPFSHARPSSSFLGPPGLFPPSNSTSGVDQLGQGNNGTAEAPGSTITYHGVCLTVWSHADAERSAAIRRTLEAGRSRKESAQSLIAARLKGLRADAQDPTIQARRKNKRNRRGPWVTGGATDGETDMDAETDGGISESDYEVGSIGPSHHNPGESTLFLPGDAVFWLPYALSTYAQLLPTSHGFDLLTSPSQPSYLGIPSMTSCATI